MGSVAAPTWVALGRVAGENCAALLDSEGVEQYREMLTDAQMPAWVAERERTASPRWIWNDAAHWYTRLLNAGVRVAKCHDLRLSHAILRASTMVTNDEGIRKAIEWDASLTALTSAPVVPTLFDLADSDSGVPTLPSGLDEALEEFARQRTVVAQSQDPARLRLLVAAESAGALIAAELTAAGVPWDVASHERILVDVLGERPMSGGVPPKLVQSAARVREALGDPGANLDSPPKLLRALHRAGILVESTSRWELSEQRHPAIEPLLEYKKLTRLLSANGWAWLSEWVSDGRFRPVYVPGGVVTGRWASSGGGALQLPRQLRAAVRADPGWRLVVADVAQLEPRVLAAMAGDVALADAARGRDLYAGIVERGAVTTRAEAKIAMLGAMYGATTGDSGRLVPRLRRTFPRAMDLVDDAARVGEDGGIVSTWLGRSCPGPGEEWQAGQSRATEAEASGAEVDLARRWARDRGRFTRNFVVQGTAAEWALAWLADLRGRLAAIPPVAESTAALRSGPVASRVPHLALFLHDEVVIHTPAVHAELVAKAVQDAASAAARLLFGGFPIDFPLDVRIAETAMKD
ncbi:bifunctional 3'-5' exonuclease/DNA polymerase [Microbacterium lacus]|uniref:bifunctional 3'-5' exonuclease/DNA polymerase n=1 Tax=Microbacterium lacus TaxID=415217 RepID=UPI00384CE379